MKSVIGSAGNGARRGFTLIELLTALLILSLLGLMSYRGLGAVLDARSRVDAETGKWRSVAAFFARFERDIRLAAPRPVRTVSGNAPAWHGQPGATATPLLLEFSRFATAEDVDTARRIGYRLNGQKEVELWLWPGLDAAPSTQPARHVVLAGITGFELHYLDDRLAWVNAWPMSGNDSAIPRAVRVRLVLASGEEIARVFALQP